MVKKLRVNEANKSNTTKTKARTDIHKQADEILSTVNEIKKILDSYSNKIKNILDNTDAYITTDSREFDEYLFDSNMWALNDNMRILDEFKHNIKHF